MPTVLDFGLRLPATAGFGHPNPVGDLLAAFQWRMENLPMPVGIVYNQVSEHPRCICWRVTRQACCLDASMIIIINASPITMGTCC